ncbi:MAG: hypothetical protein ACJ72E_14170 [Marmoricola sp.]
MSGAEEAARRAREDADFQRIVEGFGDAPQFPDLEPAAPAAPAQPDVPAELAESPWLEEEHFVPEPPPPVPRPRGPRALAWLGLVGIPVIGALALIVHLPVPSPIPFVLLIGFVASFGFLVATMSGEDQSGWDGDDGAVL